MDAIEDQNLRASSSSLAHRGIVASSEFLSYQDQDDHPDSIDRKISRIELAIRKQEDPSFTELVRAVHLSLDDPHQVRDLATVIVAFPYSTSIAAFVYSYLRTLAGPTVRRLFR